MDLRTESERVKPDKESIGTRIKAARITKAKMTQDQLAKAMNTTISTISKTETGTRQVKPEEIQRFAEALGVSKAYLEGETVAMDAPTALMSEFEKQFSRITTADKYSPQKEVYPGEDFLGVTIAMTGEYLVMESNTGIFDLVMEIAKVNEDSHLTEEERRNRLVNARQNFVGKPSGGETKTYLVLTPEQLDEIVERRTKATICLCCATMCPLQETEAPLQ